MTLNQALSIVNSSERTGPKKVYYLVCGFEPLHFATFLKAHLLERLPQDDVEIRSGLYGDLVGNIDRATSSPATAAIVVLEWGDLDPRLGLRSSGGWGGEAKTDIVGGLARRFAQLETGLEKLAGRMPVAVARPSLPLPPVGNTIRAQSSVLELELEQQMAAVLLRLARIPGVRVIQAGSLDSVAHPDSRLDAGMELMAGFPYKLAFAGELASASVAVLHQRPPKKGLITDLDDTFWSGLVGENGVDGVSWQQEHHTQIHGIYQQMLGHLADSGILLAVCSKNEAATVETALARKDLFLDPATLFPVCANWGPKSTSVGKILRAWNIGEDAVVFVDDNQMELEEVKRAYPGITCLHFRGKSPALVWNLLGELRDLFGKPVLTEEDKLRRDSLRAAAQIEELGERAATPEFLQGLKGVVTVSWGMDPADKRPLELINKTNQFNLNGLRVDEGDWQRRLEAPNAVLAVISYRDKFGPLGKVAVAMGMRTGGHLRIIHWVMSCRAFSRRLEHHTLECLFRHSGVEEIEFAFQPTEKNQPTQFFFEELGSRRDESGRQTITRADFLSRCGSLPHKVSEVEK